MQDLHALRQNTTKRDLRDPAAEPRAVASESIRVVTRLLSERVSTIVTMTRDCSVYDHSEGCACVVAWIYMLDIDPLIIPVPPDVKNHVFD